MISLGMLRAPSLSYRAHPRIAAHVRLQPRAQVGVVLQDVTGRVLVASEEAARLLEVDGPEALTGRDSLFAGSIRADGSTLSTDQEPGMLALRTGQAQEPIVLGLRRRGDDVYWVRVSAEPLFKVGSTAPYATTSRIAVYSRT